MFHFFTNYSRSPKWKSVRKDHLETQPYCQACGSKKDLEVHHIEPFHLNPDRELDPHNLITLCSRSCHLTFGHLMDYKSWNTDVVKDCSNYLSKLQQRPYHENYSQKPMSNSIISNLINFITFGYYRP
jgi:hypothetical protein